ncbi:MAG TPA: hypothetical protein VIB39_22660 [Candidatus Angelobacter sp.]|jgi:hypothetical protein
MPLKQKYQTVMLMFLTTLACLLFILSANGRFRANKGKPASLPARVELCEVLRNSEFYEGKQITVKATFRLGRKQSQLFCMGCIDSGRVWMREVLPASGEIAPGLKRLNDLIQENENGIMVNGIFTGTFRGPGVYGRLGAFTYQVDVQEVREIEVIYNAGPDPEDLSAEMRKKVCQ